MRAARARGLDFVPLINEDYHLVCLKEALDEAPVAALRALLAGLAPRARTVLVLRDVPPGRYGVTVMHDRNANGKLDSNIVGIPTEPDGASRGARGRMGPPAFEDAAVDMQGDTALTIHLH